MSTAVPRPIMVAGVADRSGTHLLQHLLSQHPECTSVYDIRSPWGSTWHDQLVQYGDRLHDYRSQLFATWEESGVPTVPLRERFDALAARWVADFLRSVGDDEQGRRVVSKSVFPEHLHLVAPWLLTEVDVVPLVRDPRAVLRSAQLTFRDSLGGERRLRAYVRTARSIIEYQRRTPGAVVVRYEDLLTDRPAQLRRIFDYLGLDADSYDYEAASAAPIQGSSNRPKDENRWWEVKWDPSFDGARRGSQLSPHLRRRVEWVAAAEMDAFGYGEVEPAAWRQRVYLTGRDTAYQGGRLASRMMAAARSALATK